MRFFNTIWFALFALMITTTGSYAAQLPITNFSFELPAQSAVNGYTSNANPVGWTGTSSRGVFRPSAANLPQGPTDGIQVGWSNGGTLSQTLASTLAANTQYILEVDILNRSTINNISSTLQLWAGSNLLAESVITGGARSTTVTQKVTFLTGATPANLGQALTITLISGGSQSDWDNVRLSASPPEPATKLGFVQQPSNTQTGAAINPAVTVAIQNQYGDTVTTDTRTVTIALGNNPGSGSLSGTLSVAAVAGVATFDNLSIDTIGNGYTLVASDDTSAFANATSDAFNLTVYAQLLIENHSFELPVQSAVNGYTSNANPVGWTGSSSRGVFRPSAANLPQGPTDGIQVGWSNGGTLSQTLSATLKANTQYVLEVDILNRSTVNNISSTLQLSAGSNLLAESIIEGGARSTTVTQRVTFLTGATHADLGKALMVTLISGGSQSDWDNVRLTAAPPGPPTQLGFVQQPGNTQAGAAIDPAVTVAIQNQYGDTVTSSTRTVTIALGSNPGSGTLSGTTSIAAVAGIATFADLSIDTIGNGYTLIISDDSNEFADVTSEAFNLTTYALLPITNYSFELPPQGSVNGYTSNANPVGWTGTSSRGVFRPSAANLPQGPTDGIQVGWSNGGTLSQTLSATLEADTQYILEVDILNRSTVNNISSTLQLWAGSDLLAESIITGGTRSTTVTQRVTYLTDATPANLGQALSITLISGGSQSDWDNVRLSASPPGPATQLGFVQQPSNTQAGKEIDPAVTVAIQNQFGDTVTSDTRMVTIALGNNPGGGTLSGSVSVAAVAGIATFNNLSIDSVGNGYTLIVSDDTSEFADVTSDPFNLTTYAQLDIINYSFELPPQSAVNGYTSNSNPVGWTGAGSRGVFRPGTGYLPQGPSDGIQVGWSNGGTLSQTLSATLEANTQYILEVDILNRSNINNISSTLQLWAGSSLLAESIITGGTRSTTVTQTVTHITGATPAELGQALKITLISGGSQSDWDNVRLSATPQAAEASFHYAMDEKTWGPVVDSVGGLNATAVNGAKTLATTPAIAGDPGTCGYGVFDGVDDYVVLPGSFENLQGSFTVTAWIKPANLQTGSRIFIDDEKNTKGYGFSLGDPGSGRLRFYSRGVNPVSVDTGAVISANTWTFVAAVHDSDTKSRQIYVNGVAQIITGGSTSNTYTGSWGVDTGPASIGGETNSGETANRFTGAMDEVKIYKNALSAAQIMAVYAETHGCSGINDVTVAAGDTAEFTVTLSEAAISAVDISYSTSDGTAVAGTDYTAATGTLTIPAGQTSGTISIETLNGHQAADVIFQVDITSEDVQLTIVSGTGTITPSGCTLGSFAITQAAYGLACPDTAAAVTITAYCDDGTTIYEDYDGLVSLTADKAGALFYDAASSGSSITEYQYTGAEGGVASVYLYYNDEAEVTVTGSDGTVTAVAAAPTAFKTEGFAVSVPGNLTCGTTSTMSITALGQVSAQTGCDIIEGFQGIKSMKSWFVGATDSVGQADDPTMQPIRLDDVGGANQALAVQDKPTSTNIALSFINGVATPSVKYQNGADTYVGHIKSIAFEYLTSPNDGVTLPVIYGEDATGFNFYPHKLEISNPTVSCIGSTDSALSLCPVFSKAGEEFTQTVKMLCSDSDNLDLSDNPEAQQYSGTHTLSHALVSPSSGLPGDLGYDTITLVNGVGTIANQTISEVGVFDLSVAGATYFSQSIAADTQERVGRFIPDHFEISKSDGVFDVACSGGYSYLGQPFLFQLAPTLTITAKSKAVALPAVTPITTNYTLPGFQKLAPADISRTFVGTDASNMGNDGINPLNATATLNVPSAFTSATSGVITYTFDLLDEFQYTKDSNSLVSPFTSDLDIVINTVIDSDGVAADVAAVTPISPTGSVIRYGRWNMENGFAPEISPLTIYASAEYYDATENWLVNNDDTCSDLTGVEATNPVDADMIAIPVGTGTTYFTFSSPLSGGEGGFSFTAPGSEGAVEISVDLNALQWLRYNWDRSVDGSLEDHPPVKATFGRYRGHDRVIYWREVVQ